MSLNLHLPMQDEPLKPKITVIGVGGAGGNAVNNMIQSHLEGISFVAANTDAQALEHSLAPQKIQLGLGVTQGLGAGASPDVGRAAAEETINELTEVIQGSNMVFITAGMGGGTGTGASPVVARIAKEMGILTVGVVTKPFHFEGSHRMKLAEGGLEELTHYADTLIIIPNQNLFRLANENTTFANAFKMADDVLHSGVRGVTDLMLMDGLVNLDFADIRTVMSEMGKAMMGTGEAEGEERAVDAAEAAISNPLLDDISMKGARSLLINITGGNDMKLFEVDEAVQRVKEEVDPHAHIIFGATFNDELEGKMRVSVVATGIEADKRRATPHQAPQRQDTTAKRSIFNKAPAPKPEAQPEPERELEPALEGVLNHPFKREATAAAPRPEPTVNTNAYASQTRNDYASEDYYYQEERRQPRAATPKKGRSLFGRIADAFSGGGDSYSKEPSIRISPSQDYADDGYDEDMDIPTFLRKK